MWQKWTKEMLAGDVRALARCISLAENEATGYVEMLASLPIKNTPVIGITGPPGAGKSSITDALIGLYVADNKRVTVLCVDPSSPFNLGAILGDRVRMSNWYNHPQVYIRSLATRGALGGLSPKIVEITDIIKAGNSDVIIVETVGVGQSEIEIAGLADVTIVTMVPEGGDDIQTMKAGIMEIADIFVVNKADRPGAGNFVKHLTMMLAPAFTHSQYEIPIIKTVATKKEGIEDLYNSIQKVLGQQKTNSRKKWLMAAKAYSILQHYVMQKFDKEALVMAWERDAAKGKNVYAFVQAYIAKNEL